MSALRSAIEELAATELATVPDDGLDQDVGEISRALSMLTAQLVARVGEAERRGSFQRHGFLNPTRWLAVTADMDDATARRHVSMANTCAEIPETAARFLSGELSYTRARILCRAASDRLDLYRRDQHLLLGFAEELTVQQLTNAARHWTYYADDAAAEMTSTQMREKSYLHASVTFGGMVRVDALLDPETGETVLTALDAATPPPSADDRRSAANRRAEALGGICGQWLANGTTTSGGTRPHVSLVVDLDTLEGRMGKHCRLDHVGTVTAETARRIVCDASVSRIITRGGSQPLDVGRATRVPSSAQRQALVIRDGGCKFPGCSRPPPWCDAHHITHWLHGGPTDLDNLMLLCRRHHALVHQGAATIRDGTVLVE